MTSGRIRIAILGGGVAGVVLARHLARNREVSVDLIEREGRLGGLHRTLLADGAAFDIGAFIFYEGHALHRAFPSLNELFVRVRPQLVSVTPAGRFSPYPLNAASYLRENGLLHAMTLPADLLLSRLRFRRRDTVPAYAKFYMGSQLYERSGLRGYVERLYGISGEEVGLEFARQRLVEIRAHTPLAVLRRKLLLRFKPASPAAFPTFLVRPEAGFDALYAAIEDELERDEVRVFKQCEVRGVSREGKRFRVVTAERDELYDRVVSTIPIPVMLRLVGERAQGDFETMSLLSLFYRGRMRHKGALIYNFSRLGKWKRITVFSELYGRIGDDDYFTVEVTTRDTTAPHLESLRADFEQHAASVGLCEPGTLRIVGQHLTARAYPLFRRGRSDALQRDRDRLTEFGIAAVGRQGEFAYLSSDEVGKRAEEIARELQEVRER